VEEVKTMTKVGIVGAVAEAPLLERIRERVARAKLAATRVLNKGSERETEIISPAYVNDLATAIELITIELTEINRRLNDLEDREEKTQP
jgi:Mg2+ and Co2+ transporter CorA